jgi:hypothetical protein
MPRKTIDVAQLIEWVNTRCAAPDSPHTLTMEGRELTPEQAFRLGVASLLGQVLHATGNYKGFSYNDSELETPSKLRDGYDGTRRKYHG